ncbi:IS66 family insertion sequence element accessory protein TnpB [Methylomonas paludis]|uniref:IS66 family insertion sequence element accessory protein TnpB n=1 Tax=Methylomonas paludis TaxID=1173101 RepID=A0A975MQZ3_9GAMM|nr:IS66 family insertion sequence element accessory protein TnpB [Methylomonas paludis]QWF72387.1 IS66 family insertion sequence element accessory protein TnpB [Methylomonas paludis]
MTRIMRPSLELTQVYLYRQPIDFRKSHRGLAAIVECELGHNPFGGGLVLIYKYCDGLPLYRLESILSRYGGELSRAAGELGHCTGQTVTTFD